MSSEKSFLSVNPGEVSVTAFKQIENGNSGILRLYETADEPVNAKIRMDWNVKKAKVIDAIEREEKRS